jgi:hypothetical protein
MGDLQAEQVSKRPPIIAVRPRKGSVLEAQQKALNNDMADTIHQWAEAFSMEKDGEKNDE